MKATIKSEDVAKAEAKAVAMRQSGAKWSEILAATGLNHSRAELAVMRAELPKAEADRCAKLVAAGFDQACFTLRGEGFSWGQIAVRVGRPEGSVRTGFKNASGLKSQGQRIAKGGRFYLAEGLLYQDVLRPTGTDIPKDAIGREGARISAASQRLGKLEFGELKNLAADHGVTGTTKAQLILGLKKAMGLVAEKPAKAVKASA